MTNNRVAIITGAAGGIGSQLAMKFASADYAVALVDVDHIKLAELSRQLSAMNAEYLIIDGDLASERFLKQIVTAVIEKWGRIDVLVNNAVWRTRETLRSITRETWDRTIDVCLTAPAFLTKFVAEEMEKRNIKGAIINISSIQSQLAGGGSPAYTACKGAIESLTYETAVLFGPKGIRAIAVSPGNISTGLSADIQNESSENVSDRFDKEVIANTPLQRGGGPEEIASLVKWLCSDEASFITGTNIIADGGYSHSFIPYPLKKLQLEKDF